MAEEDDGSFLKVESMYLQEVRGHLTKLPSSQRVFKMSTHTNALVGGQENLPMVNG